jgi:sigma-B regulation protein RsbU (phosphoserine phosphatase)
VTDARAFPGTLDGAAEAEAWAAAECGRRALSPDSAYALTLCVEELFVNAVRHGRAREIRLALTPAGLEFRDDGEAFDPTRAPAKRLQGPAPDFEVGGFGVGLVRQFADRLDYAREAGWNVVTLAFTQ